MNEDFLGSAKLFPGHCAAYLAGWCIALPWLVITAPVVCIVTRRGKAPAVNRRLWQTGVGIQHLCGITALGRWLTCKEVLTQGRKAILYHLYKLHLGFNLRHSFNRQKLKTMVVSRSCAMDLCGYINVYIDMRILVPKVGTSDRDK